MTYDNKSYRVVAPATQSLYKRDNHVKDYKFFCHLCGKVIKKTGRDKGHLKLCSKRS